MSEIADYFSTKYIRARAMDLLRQYADRQGMAIVDIVETGLEIKVRMRPKPGTGVTRPFKPGERLINLWVASRQHRPRRPFRAHWELDPNGIAQYDRLVLSISYFVPGAEMTNCQHLKREELGVNCWRPAVAKALLRLRATKREEIAEAFR